MIELEILQMILEGKYCNFLRKTQNSRQNQRHSKKHRKSKNISKKPDFEATCFVFLLILILQPARGPNGIKAQESLMQHHAIKILLWLGETIQEKNAFIVCKSCCIEQVNP